MCCREDVAESYKLRISRLVIPLRAPKSFVAESEHTSVVPRCLDIFAISYDAIRTIDHPQHIHQLSRKLC